MPNMKTISNAHRKALDLKAQIETLKLEYHAQTDILATMGSGKHTTEHGSFQVSENNTYDEQVMTDALSKGQFMKCSERKLVNALVKHFYPNVYAAAKVRKGFKVSV